MRKRSLTMTFVVFGVLAALFLSFTISASSQAASHSTAEAQSTDMRPMTGTMPMGSMGQVTGTMSSRDMAQMMQLMGTMMEMMGHMQDVMPVTGTMPISGTMPMQNMTQMMDMMMQMMGHMMPMTGTVPMQNMAQMMNMMGMMMQMMGHMQSLMPMTDTMPMGAGMGPMMPGAMPMTGTVPMQNMAPMMDMMGLMMQMMGHMQGIRPPSGTMPMTSTVSMQNMTQMMNMMMQMMGHMMPMQGGVMGMPMGMQPSMHLAPLVRGLYAGEELFFIHTEASDPEVAQLLTEMMGPQVVLAPELAEVPASALANVYVFTNGIEGSGPFGFQPDVFDAVPGDVGYSPLRTVSLITWQEDSTPRQLSSVEEIEAAQEENELTIEQSDIVVNMPVLSWPGGHR